MSRCAALVFSVAFLATPLVADEVGLPGASTVVKASVTPDSSVPETSPESIPWLKDLDKGRAEMRKSKQPMMLFLTAPSCVYCDQMKQDTFSQKWIIKEVSKNYTPVLINGREHKKITKLLRVRMYPATAIVHPSGKVVEMAQGYKSPPDFLRHMAVAQARLKQEDKKMAMQQPTSTTLK